jgi:flagellar basal body-associated protein FliL
MKRKVVLSISALILVVLGYYLIQFYHMSKGVKEDAERMEKYQVPKTFQLNDSITVVTDTTLDK